MIIMSFDSSRSSSSSSSVSLFIYDSSVPLDPI